MRQLLLSWIGRTDLRAPAEADVVGLGPIAQALTYQPFDEVFLVTDYPAKETEPFETWLNPRSMGRISVAREPLSSPMAFSEIYEAAVRLCELAVGSKRLNTQLFFHLSPGTPAMAAVWILLAKTRFPAELLESSKEHGVKRVELPFDISVDFLPDLLREHDERLRNLSAARPPEGSEFADIIYRSRVMDRIIQRARRVAVRNVPVLIEGESGTGKEMMARAIHRASPRSGSPFIAVNCGAIPNELVEAELFGHEKGAFTGANQSRRGYFEAANKGTLFLDEIGELPQPAQVKLLRVLQEGQIVRLGTTKTTDIDVRIVAATNRALTEEIAAGRFREDLFYRLAVAVLKIPSLRERSEDLGLLTDHLLNQVNREGEGEPNFRHKKLSAGARNIILAHSWPGNVRELLNTLRRAATWSDSVTITAEDAREALLPAASRRSSEVLGKPIGVGFKLSELLTEVARHYLERAMSESNGSKTRAAELVGLSSYQTLTNWLKKYGLE